MLVGVCSMLVVVMFWMRFLWVMVVVVILGGFMLLCF